RPGRPSEDLPGGLEPVHGLHPDVHEHDVGHQPERLVHGHAAVVRLTNNRDVRLGVKDHPEAGPDQPFVVDDEDLDGHAGTSSAGRCAYTLNPPSSVGPASAVPPDTAARSWIPMSPSPAPAKSPASMVHAAEVTTAISL